MKNTWAFLWAMMIAAVLPIRSPKDAANQPAIIFTNPPVIIDTNPIPIVPMPFIRSGEFWVSPYPTNALGTGIVTGQGTLASPYTGDFDTIISLEPTNTTAHLGPGVFYTKGDGTWAILGNRRIVGAGKFTTTIRRDPRFSYNQNQPVLTAAGDNITLEDFTIDAACTNGEPYSHNAISLFGDNPVLRGLNVVGVSGKWPNLECFSYFICPTVNDPSFGGTISGCSLSDVMGDYVEGFSVWGGCRVVNCDVTFPTLTNNAHPPFFNGFQAAHSYGARFDRCRQIGGSGFFYTDTGSDSDLSISDCFAWNIMQGVVLVRHPGEYIDGFSVYNCVFELSTNAQVSLGANAIAESDSSATPGIARNVRAYNNFIRYVGGAAGPAENYGRILAVGIVGGNRAGTVIQNNSWDPGFTWAAEPGATVSTNMPAASLPK